MLLRLPALPFLLLVVLALASGCASKVRPVGQLAGGYENFNALDRKNIKIRLNEEPDRSYEPMLLSAKEKRRMVKRGEPIPTPASLGLDPATSQVLLLVIAPPQWTAKHPFDDKRVEELSFTLRERLYRYMLREYPHPVRVRYAYAPQEGRVTGHRIVTLTSRITEVKGGNAVLRYLVGFGLGAVRVQIEGELMERTADGEVVLGEYVMRTWHTGYAQNGLNPAVLRMGYVTKYAIEELALRLSRELPNHLIGVRQRPESEGAAKNAEMARQ